MRKKIIFSWICFLSASSQIVFSARFSLSTESSTVYLDCPFEVKVLINTQWREITAADMNILYNDNLFEVKDFVLWDSFLINWWLKTSRNRLRSTALSYPTGFSGAWEFATVILEAKRISKETHIKFDVEWYGEKYTRDSNLAFDGKDYLSESNELILNIKKWECPHNISTSGWAFFDENLTEEEFKNKRESKVVAGNAGEVHMSITESWVDRSWFAKFWYWFVYIWGGLLVAALIVVIVRRKKEKK